MWLNKMNSAYFKNLWLAGTSVLVMARIFNLSRSTIRRRADKLGLPRRGKPEPVNAGWQPVVHCKEIPDRHHCHFPIGDPKNSDFGYCGLPVFKRSYCIKCYGEVYK